jgi:hypothetical protein
MSIRVLEKGRNDSQLQLDSWQVLCYRRGERAIFIAMTSADLISGRLRQRKLPRWSATVGLARSDGWDTLDPAIRSSATVATHVAFGIDDALLIRKICLAMSVSFGVFGLPASWRLEDG